MLEGLKPCQFRQVDTNGRVLCNLLGTDMEKGEIPNDEALVGEMVRRICFDNARDYLGLELPTAAPALARS